jgi:hypothetical protein
MYKNPPAANAAEMQQEFVCGLHKSFERQWYGARPVLPVASTDHRRHRIRDPSVNLLRNLLFALVNHPATANNSERSAT